jgi:hypothetical protein
LKAGHRRSKSQCPERFCYVARAMVKGGDGLTGRVQISVKDGAIVVTLAGTGYSVTYRRTCEAPWLIASDIRDDPVALFV